ncbi:hypothetical protein QUF63_07280 [Anaerolineales bacterium HSG25]|nr:hypothetical protein [Anaerolineales bacterium HSG25]
MWSIGKKANELEENAETLLALASIHQQLEPSVDITTYLQQAQNLLEDTDYGDWATWAALSGDKEKALAYLEKAIEKEKLLKVWYKRDPDLAILHGDPRFEALVG